MLVTDDTAEDGLNLQVADAVLHLRLPWSPNQLEQRLGRVDRYPDASASAGTRPAVRHQRRRPGRILHRRVGGAPAGWLRRLRRFDLHPAGRRRGWPVRTWRAGMESGPAGLQRLGGEVRADLDTARRDIDKVDMLESIHESSADERDITAALGYHPAAMADDARSPARVRGDRRWRDRAPASEPDGAWGPPRSLRPGAITPAALTAAMEAGRAPGEDADGPRRIQPVSRPAGARDAPAAAQPTGGRIGRGDRGRRPRAGHSHPPGGPAFTGDPEPYFGFDYLVEAEITQALRKLEGRPEAGAALRRQADRIMPPFTLKAWIGAAGEQPISDPDARAWLDSPYNKTGGDRNYSRERRGELRTIFGGWASFQASAEEAESRCRQHLAEVTDLEQVSLRTRRDRARSVLRGDHDPRPRPGRPPATWSVFRKLLAGCSPSLTP